MKRSEIEAYRQAALTYLDRAGIVLRPEEKAGLEVADFGLGEFGTTGLMLHTYVNTERVCAKELVLLPRQTCPQHLHPSVGGEAGKEETFRCRWGTVYLYVEGEPTLNPQAQPPAHRRETYTALHEVILHSGGQYTLLPDTWHWFQGGDEGAVVSEFSTRSRDEADEFTDAGVRRLPVVEA
ncbi:MAG: D-lyxose isomerase [uncultured Truepera sp.]|uniref:D-lyxose ketol-isomerase n=1 Tax=uncultured Truepera sp. TaxID=543023 RepID=A0A6J4V848_9DEIN|nr:MAG: D-lyxose isomerase [uncultured Truepera sp.]